MKQVISILKLLLLTALLSPAARGQGNDASKKITDQLSRFEANYPAEKAYLQFDKPYYAAGDTIYFKAYVTAGEQHKLSSLSGVLQVELINTKNKIDQSIKLKLDSGLAWGDFALPDSLPAGNYRVRAYTQWMRNFGETGFFDKVIPVGSIKAERVPESLVKQPVDLKPDVQFFPEGGSLVIGIKSRVAFKAVSANGLGVDVRGSIIDNDNREVAQFESAHLGMGSFYITPIAGKSYKVRISYPDGRQDLIDLPKPTGGGIILSVNNDSIPNASIQIAASADYYAQNRGKTYTLVIYSPGSATTVNCKLDSPVINLDILKRKLHTGVATITLFSPENEPLCERLFFVQNYDQLTVTLSSNKNSYAKREKVNIKLYALNRKGDPSTGHFSVAVVDESKVQETDHNSGNILTNLLLTSDLKGFIEQPNYYFEDTSMAARKNLDILMLTQGYRRFEWKQVLDSSKISLAYQPEKGLSVEGSVKNVFNKTVANGTVNLWQPIGGLLLSAKTDGQGRFSFPGLVFSDTAHMVLSAIKANGKNSTQITWLDENTERPIVQSYKWQSAKLFNDSTIVSFVANDRAAQKATLAYLNGKGVMLKQVNIHSKKPDNQYRTQSLAGAGNADQVVHSDKLDRIGGPLSIKLAGQFHGPLGFNITRGIMPGLIVVDGVLEPGNFRIDDVVGNQVETVELLEYGSTAIYGAAGGGGVMIITTKQGGGTNIKDVIAMGVLPINVMGYYKGREFYSPKYENPLAAVNRPDLRSTIYWNPEIKTDATGNASFDFFNADGTGNYKVTIEGIDTDGNIGRQEYYYEIK